MMRVMSVPDEQTPRDSREDAENLARMTALLHAMVGAEAAGEPAARVDEYIWSLAPMVARGHRELEAAVLEAGGQYRVRDRAGEVLVKVKRRYSPPGLVAHVPTFVRALLLGLLVNALVAVARVMYAKRHTSL